MEFVYFLLFIGISFICFYVPGSFLLQRLKIKSDSPFGIIEWVAGSALFILGSYIFAWLNIPWAYLIIIGLLFLFFLVSFKRNFKLFIKQWEERDNLLLVIIGIGVASFSSILFFSGWETSQGLQFMSINVADGVRHLGYIKNQINTFPPEQAGLVGVQFRGFHYFYDFMLSRFALFFNFSAENLYFRFFPVLISLFYGGAFFLLAKKITSKISSQRMILFLAFFGQSFSFLYLLFFENIDLVGSVVVQSLGLIVNPFMVYGVTLLVLGLALIPDLKSNWKTVIVIGLIYGIISQIKVYAGIPAVIIIVAYSVYNLIKYRKKYIISIVALNILTAAITALTFFPNNFGSGGLVYAPFVLIVEYMQRPMFSDLNWELRRRIFADNDNYIRIILLFSQAIALYIFINLGIRILIFLRLRKIVKKSFWRNEYNFMLFISILSLSMFGFLLIQTVSVLDTIQFFWISLVLLSFPTGIILMDYIDKISKAKIRFLAIGIIVLITLPGNISLISRYLPAEPDLLIDSSEMEIYNKIKDETSKDDFLIYIPKKDYDRPAAPIIAAITGRSIYLEHGGIPGKNTENEIVKRELKIIELDSILRGCDHEKVINVLRDMGSFNLVTYNSYTCLPPSSSIFKDEKTNLTFIKIEE